jgi:hypothetical protein
VIRFGAHSAPKRVGQIQPPLEKICHLPPSVHTTSQIASRSLDSAAVPWHQPLHGGTGALIAWLMPERTGLGSVMP